MSDSLISINSDRTLLKNNKYFIVQGILSSLFVVVMLYLIDDPLPLYILGAVVIGLATIFDYYVAFYVFLVLVLGPTMMFLHVSVLFTPFVLIAFLLKFKGELRGSVNIPVMPSIIMYILACIPSLFNTPRVFLSIRDSYNLIAFVIIILTTAIAMRTPQKIMLIFYAFICGMTIHSIIVIYLCITTGARVFGIMAVFYIDFAALAALYCLIMFFYVSGYKRLFWLILFSVNLFGLILTQTRNAWISFGLAMYTLLIYLLFKNEHFKLNKKLVSSTFIAITLIIIVAYFAALSFNPQISDRFEIPNKTVSTERMSDVFGQNSLTTRSLIWFTAYNAFTVHPIFGIGVYAFKHTSDLYYTIPDDLFLYFVKGKTPHLSFIEVITETGIFGMIFFLYFLYSVIKHLRKSLKLRQTKEAGLRTLLIGWSFVYIIFSLFMTEAWLYGQFLMWFGIMLGLSSSNYNMISANNTEEAC